MKIGLYFGTFNPIHTGHLSIANYLIEFSDLQEIWFVVTPHNPHKQKTDLLEDKHRLKLVSLALENYPKLKLSDVEFKLPQPNYTFNTLNYLEENFRKHKFSIIMGADNLNSFHKWKNYQSILERYDICVYPRKSLEKPQNEFFSHPNIQQINAPVIEISSTLIREKIKRKEDVRTLLPEKVWKYIDENLFYR